MHATEQHEKTFARINLILTVVYVLVALILAAINISKARPFYYLLAFGSLLVFPLVHGAYRFLRMERSHQLEFIIYLYAFLAFPLGVVGTLYHTIPYYDKIAHMLSGVLTMSLALPFYYKLRKGSAVRADDIYQAIIFCLFASVAVAGLWEIGEYILSLLTGMDNQNVIGTGVHDTMQDMIVCTIGALLCVPSMIAYYRRSRISPLMGGFHAFCASNGIENALWSQW